MLKGISLILVVVVISTGIYIYLNRSLIFEHSVNRLIKEVLPDNIQLRELDFDFKGKSIILKNFEVSNPKGFSRTPLARIPELKCQYSQRDEKDILKGVVLSDIVLSEPEVYIERSKKGGTNLQHMEEVFGPSKKSKALSFKVKLLAVLSFLFSPVEKGVNLKELKPRLVKIIKSPAQLIEIKPILEVKGGSLTFNDRYVSYGGYKTTVEEIDARIALKFKDGFKGVNSVETEGAGLINGQRGQILHWVSRYDSTTPKLTISNTITIQDVEFSHFQPYYDKFSPFDFKNGRASGELIFNFDNGDIGSMNELRFSATRLRVKEDYPYKDFWAVSAQELYKYFLSQSGEIIFDFKIKGPIEQPKFYPGPKVKRALARMVVDKITDTLLEKAAEALPETEIEGLPQGKKGRIKKILDKYKKELAPVEEVDEAQMQRGTESILQQGQAGIQEMMDIYKKLKPVEEAGKTLPEAGAGGISQQEKDRIKEMIDKYKEPKKSDNPGL